MSAERRWNQRRFHLEESLTQNGGARTVFIEYMTPGTTVPPHYHTRQYRSYPITVPHLSNFLAVCYSRLRSTSLTETNPQASPRPSTCSRAPSRSTHRRRHQPQPGTRAPTWTSWSGPPRRSSPGARGRRRPCRPACTTSTSWARRTRCSGWCSRRGTRTSRGC